ncbi:hypothetical protein HKD19_05895 [Gluconobacter sp. LMG 1745]|uniref:YokE-like PH domain-containing protein n=2 Tax=Gluconobacter cadivus TaxID=2728101 RepID=A0ABR9YV95_9PROT|nr:hypothetical protein [Gluconobacter cadivus]
MTNEGPRLFYWRFRLLPKSESEMRTLAPASAGDVCRRGAQHYCVLAVEGTRALCVPVIFNRTFIHRADVFLWDSRREKSLQLSGTTVVRCTDHRWRENGWDSCTLQVSPSVMRKILASLCRDSEAQAIEAGRSGLYQSTLARGPKLGDRGRKKGGSPSD